MALSPISCCFYCLVSTVAIAVVVVVVAVAVVVVGGVAPLGMWGLLTQQVMH